MFSDECVEELIKLFAPLSKRYKAAKTMARKQAVSTIAQPTSGFLVSTVAHGGKDFMKKP